MKTFVRVAFVSVLGVSVLAVDALAQARDLAFDFKITDSITSMPKGGGVSMGHAVVSKGRVRIDVKGSARGLAMPGAAAGDDVTMIFRDARTVIYIDPKKKQYMQIDPMNAIEGMQKMVEGMGATMKFEFTDGPKVENVGPGPVILGHKTRHYRITSGMKTTINMMGDSQTMEMLSVNDAYLAPGLKNMTDPFQRMSSSSTGTIGMNKAYLERLKAARARLPNAMELRGETRITVNGSGQTQNIMTAHEITAIRRMNASDDQFAVPAAFTKVDAPFMSPGGRIPPE